MALFPSKRKALQQLAIPVPPMPFQTPETPGVDRTDHIWIPHTTGTGGFKCCICGAVEQSPPPYPTPREWMPRHHELPLTPAERQMVRKP